MLKYLTMMSFMIYPLCAADRCAVYTKKIDSEAEKFKNNKEKIKNLFQFFDYSLLARLVKYEDTIEAMLRLKKPSLFKNKVAVVIFDEGAGSDNCFIKDNVIFQRNNIDSESPGNHRLRRKPSLNDPDFANTPFESHGGGIGSLMKQIYPDISLVSLRRGDEKKLAPYKQEIADDFIRLQAEQRRNISPSRTDALSLQQAKIINMSFGYEKETQEQWNFDDSKRQEHFWRTCLKNGNTLVIALGNEALDYSKECKNYVTFINTFLKSLTAEERNRMIFVGALDENDKFARFSNHFSNPPKETDRYFQERVIYAPGTAIMMSGTHNDIVKKNGTSFAAPIMAAVIARLVNEYGLTLDSAIKCVFSMSNEGKNHSMAWDKFKEKINTLQNITNHEEPQKTPEKMREIQRTLNEMQDHFETIKTFSNQPAPAFVSYKILNLDHVMINLKDTKNFPRQTGMRSTESEKTLSEEAIKNKISQSFEHLTKKPIWSFLQDWFNNNEQKIKEIQRKSFYETHTHIHYLTERLFEHIKEKAKSAWYTLDDSDRTEIKIERNRRTTFPALKAFVEWKVAGSPNKNSKYYP